MSSASVSSAIEMISNRAGCFSNNEGIKIHEKKNSAVVHSEVHGERKIVLAMHSPAFQHNPFSRFECTKVNFRQPHVGSLQLLTPFL